MSTNPYAATARRAKVDTCIAWLDGRKNDLGASDADLLRTVEGWGDAEWASLAVHAGTHPLSDESRALVLARLRARVVC